MLGKGSRPEANPRITRGGKRHKRIHGDGNSFGRNSYALNLPSPRIPLCVGGRSSVERVALASRSAPELSKETSTSLALRIPRKDASVAVEVPLKGLVQASRKYRRFQAISNLVGAAPPVHLA